MPESGGGGGAADFREPVEPALLRRRTDPRALRDAMARTDGGLVGQERALQAIDFAAAIRRPGFNLFVMGPEGTGRHGAVRRILTARARTETPPDDWVYVNNFADADRPRALNLPGGSAARLAAAMEEMIGDLGAAVPALFDSDDYKARRDAIDQEAEKAQEDGFAALNERARARGIVILRTPMGFALAPARDGAVVPPDEFNALPEAERKRIEADIERLQGDLKRVVAGLPKLEKRRRERIRALNQEMATGVVAVEIDEVRARFADIRAIQTFLSEVAEDVVKNVEIFLEKAAEARQAALPTPLALTARDRRLRRYTVNVMVGDARDGDDEGARAGAPVVFENNPTYHNLIGRVEHVSHLGALETDFTLIKPGALHRANGGYLVLDMRRLLAQPGSWEALKRSLLAGEVRISSLAEQYSLASTVSLEPDPIALSVRVVLIGERWLYYLLHALDPDFARLFKVEADFEDDMPRDAGNEAALAGLLGKLVAEEGARPPTPDGLARLFDEAARLAEDAEKLSLRIDALADILREAAHLAETEGADALDAPHVRAAVARRRDRAGRLRERLYEAITRDTLLIETEGARVGQVNGLSVIALGNQSFGRPSRITAITRVGTGKLVDIEREAKLGGPLHSKGVLILSGFLASRYALDAPMSLWASLVMEQSYGGVEGDSASSAELYALLSALAELPVEQRFAVTGSVNQMGAVQPIGGVNEKIEGFHDVCAARGLTGRQGVLIPSGNLKNLMLREDVVEACAGGRFAVHAVATVDQGLELLTGVGAGTRGADGRFPAESVNGRVEATLRAYAEARRRFAAEEGAPARGEPS